MSRIIVEINSFVQTQSVLEMLDKNQIKYKISSGEADKREFRAESDSILKKGPQQTNIKSFINERSYEKIER